MFRKYLLLYALCLTAIFAYPRAVSRTEAAPDVDLEAMVEWEANGLFVKLQERFAGPWPEFEHRPAELSALGELARKHAGLDYPQTVYLKGINFVLFYARSTGHEDAAPPLESEFWEHASHYLHIVDIARVSVARDLQALQLAKGLTTCETVSETTGRLANATAQFPEDAQFLADYLNGLKQAIDLNACRDKPEVTNRLWETYLLVAYENATVREAAERISAYLEQKINAAIKAPPFDEAVAPLYVMSQLSERAPEWVETRYESRLESALLREADVFPLQVKHAQDQAARLQDQADAVRQGGGTEVRALHYERQVEGWHLKASALQLEADAAVFTLQSSIDSLRRVGPGPVDHLRRFALAELLVPVGAPRSAGWCRVEGRIVPCSSN